MELPPDLQRAAEVELGEASDLREAKLTELKQLVDNSNHSRSSTVAAGCIKVLLTLLAESGLPKEQVLLQHLRSRKFDVSRAYKSLCLRAAFLQEHSDLAGDVQGTEFLELYRRGFMRVLPGTDKLGRRILSLHPSNLTELQVDPTLIRWIVYVMGRLARDPQFQVHGVVIVINYDLVKLADAKYMAGQLRHGRLGLMFHYISLYGFRMRCGGNDRVRFLGNNLQALHEVAGPEGLPLQLGGSLQQENELEWLEQQIQDQQQASRGISRGLYMPCWARAQPS